MPHRSRSQTRIIVGRRLAETTPDNDPVSFASQAVAHRAVDIETFLATIEDLPRYRKRKFLDIVGIRRSDLSSCGTRCWRSGDRRSFRIRASPDTSRTRSRLALLSGEEFSVLS